MASNPWRTAIAALVVATLMLVASSAAAQANPPSPISGRASGPADYVVGAQDVLTITSYDQADMSGKFTVEADGTFTYPLIGRVKAGGLTLREVERELKDRLKNDGYFKNPQIAIAVEQYHSQRIFVVGEVRSPGTYVLTGDMTLIEALARAGSTLPTAGTEALIVHDVAEGQAAAQLADRMASGNVVHVDLKALESGRLLQNIALRDGDTIFVPRAVSVYVFGQVKSPGAYPLQQENTTVLQALSLAGGVTDRGSTSRVRVVRIVNGEKKEFRVKLGDRVMPGDTIIVPERFF